MKRYMPSLFMGVALLLVGAGCFSPAQPIGETPSLPSTPTTSTPSTQPTSTGSVPPGGSSSTNSNLSTFNDPDGRFQFTYNADFMLDLSKVANGPWRSGTATTGTLHAYVTLPRAFQQNTNFSEAFFTVGSSNSPAVLRTCTTEVNGNTSKPEKVTINGVAFTRLSEGDAGAGNFYDTTSYRAVHNGRCWAVEYTIHSTNIGNYSPDSGIKEFDSRKVTNALEDVVESFKFL